LEALKMLVLNHHRTEHLIYEYCRKSYQNNAKGTGFASVFGLLTEAYFSCLRTAAEMKVFEDQVCKLPMDPEKFATF
jgi:hypothetical protein